MTTQDTSTTPSPAATSKGSLHWLKSPEVATRFRVNSGTVARWAAEGRLEFTCTPGGHRRFHATQIEALLRGETPPPLRDLLADWLRNRDSEEAGDA